MKLLIAAIVAVAVAAASLPVQAGDATQAFTSVSNIMKTKHDTAKNSISNIR